MKIAYADPPYLGCGHYYPERQEVDHVELLWELMRDYDCWALSCSSPSLGSLLNAAPIKDVQSVRVAAWVKPFASFKPNVNPGYAWEPVIFRTKRERHTREQPTVRDWVVANITLRKGLVGAKPPSFCYWLFELLGCEANDEFDDLYPGTGIVTKCWRQYQEQLQQKQTYMTFEMPSH